MWGRSRIAADGARSGAGRWRVLLVWAIFAAVVWNVVFDRQVDVAAARFTRESVERYAAGGTPVTIETGYRPAVGRAAGQASLWAGGVLVVGVALTAARRRTANGGRVDPGRSA